MSAARMAVSRRSTCSADNPTLPRALWPSFSDRVYRKSSGLGTSETELIPHKDRLTVCFAHVAYQMQAQFERRKTGIASFQAWNREELEQRIGEADVLVISGLWRN